MTIIDGKVLSAILDVRSEMTCPICGANPKSFNELPNVGSSHFRPNAERLKFGISPLHAWIRCFEFCLHLSYKMEIKSWQVRKDKQSEFEKKKRHLQSLLKEKMGLLVDIPKPGGSGTTNDGNTARRAFHEPQLFASCLGLDERFLQDLATILIALNCQYSLNAERFGNFCTDLLLHYVSLYNWNYMTVTVHKILIHGKDIAESSVLPLGENIFCVLFLN